MAIEVNDEAVATESVADGARLEQAHVHPAGAELLEHLDEAAGVVIGQLGDDARLVGAGRLGQTAASTDQHETGHRTGVVTDVLGQYDYIVVRRDAGRGNRGIGEVVLEQRGRSGDIRRCRNVAVTRQVRVEPQVGLPIGDRVCVDDLDIRQCGSGPGDEHEVDWHEVFADDAQVGDHGKGIL